MNDCQLKKIHAVHYLPLIFKMFGRWFGWGYLNTSNFISPPMLFYPLNDFSFRPSGAQKLSIQSSRSACSSLAEFVRSPFFLEGSPLFDN